MKKLLRFGLFSLTVLATIIANAQQTDGVTLNPNQVKDSTKKSFPSRAIGIIGHDTVTIDYHSPGVRGRVIWGGLVPFDDVWVTGAHSATSINIPKTFFVAGKEIPGGKYAIFTIPGKDEWTLILNKNWDQHLADDYNAAEDIVRVKVKPMQTLHTERLQYFIEPGKGTKGVIAIAWDKIRVELPFELK
jgi:hypothetical protein